MAITETVLEIRGLKLVRERAGTEGREKRTIQGFQWQDKSGKAVMTNKEGTLNCIVCVQRLTDGFVRQEERACLRFAALRQRELI